MSLVSVGQRGLTNVIKAFEEAGLKADAGLKRAINLTALAIQSKAKSNVTAQGAVDTGKLRRDIIVRFRDGGKAASIEAASDYASYIEAGTHHSKMPPPSALADWVQRHGLPPGAAFAIARAIKARGGLKPRPFLLPAWREESVNLPDRIAAEVQKALYKGAG